MSPGNKSQKPRIRLDSYLKMHLLLLSNTKNFDLDHLEHAKNAIKDLLGSKIKKVLFIPYAQVLRPYDAFADGIRRKFKAMGYGLESIHEASDPLAEISNAEAIFVGGGNTFNLLHHLRSKGLETAIYERVAEGMPYIGSSAGSNVACPTIMTTNDMPIIELEGFTGLGLIPFQINPHFTDDVPAHFQGETRSQRIEEFIELNPATYVVGLKEGSMLRIAGASIKLLGTAGARIFKKGQLTKDYSPGSSLSFLLPVGQSAIISGHKVYTH